MSRYSTGESGLATFLCDSERNKQRTLRAPERRQNVCCGPSVCLSRAPALNFCSISLETGHLLWQLLLADGLLSVDFQGCMKTLELVGVS